mgnify:FL=1|tara:strand:- start:1767 stop:3158 length:1392 start_codon:yes stop_codon:yes gene_type:complete
MSIGFTTIVWFRFDLRISDNAALYAASQNGPVIPLFIWSPAEEDFAPGAASKWWLHRSLTNLEKSLDRIGGKLILKTGTALEALKSVLQQTGAQAVFWNRRYEPITCKRDKLISTELNKAGIEVKTFKANLLSEPDEIENKTGRPFKVFTPFWKECLKRLNPPAPLEPPKQISRPTGSIKTQRLSELNLEPVPDWAEGIRNNWNPGEAGASQNLKLFIRNASRDYSEARNFPDRSGTSRLSPHLRFGEISPKQIWHSIKDSGEPKWKESHFLSELGWREFGYHLLHHFPHTVEEALRPAFNRFPWTDHPKHLRAWQLGQTGYPFVDAGMRELWATGWMHNRVRMVVASFLVKHLLIHWRHGADWFWDTLVDADLASNTQGWQWTAGCGADAAPYFRIFNPTTQAKKFDPNGDYIRRWVPELRHLSAPEIFEPSTSVEEYLYPKPIVNHSQARTRALKAFEKIK